MTPLKELAFQPMGGNDRVRETGKGSWEKSEFDTGEGDGGDSNKLHTFSKFNVM